ERGDTVHTPSQQYLCVAGESCVIDASLLIERCQQRAPQAADWCGVIHAKSSSRSTFPDGTTRASGFPQIVDNVSHSDRPMKIDDVTLGFGGAPLGNLFAPIADDAAVALVRHAHQRGVRYFDTAPHYGNGLSEHRIGAA